MIYKKIYLKDVDLRIKDETVSLRIYICDRNELISLRPGMLICPGGAYAYCSPRESEPVAFRFLSEGFHCFVLDYSVKKTYPAPHIDLAVAMNYIREHEVEFDLIPNSVSIAGFSAGGHLVSSYGYLYPELAKELGLKEERLRPFSIIAAYPVTLTTIDTHGGTKKTICGNNPALEKKLNIPSNIGNNYPPTFVWTTKDDEAVPYINSIKFVDALKEHSIKHDYIIFDSGWHGSSVCNRSCFTKEKITEKMKDIRDWASRASDFIFELLDSYER